MNDDTPTMGKRPAFHPGAKSGQLPKTRDLQAEADARVKAQQAYLAEHGDKMRAVIAQAREHLAKWGPATSSSRYFGSLCRHDYLNAYEIMRLEELMRDTIRRAELKAAKYLAADPSTGVNWPEHVVIEAVRFLCACDADHATDANNEGWSGKDSPTGHWCNAAFATDQRDVALAAARQVVGWYKRQLKLQGII